MFHNLRDCSRQRHLGGRLTESLSAFMCIRVCACTRVRMSVQAVHDFYATQRRDRSWLRRECRCEGTVEAGGLVSLGCISVLLAEYAATVNDMFSQMTMTTTKQIDHKAYIPAELSRFDRYTQLFLSFPSLFPPLCFSSGAPSQL